MTNVYSGRSSMVTVRTAVHHTLPVSSVCACGVARSVGMEAGSGPVHFSFDLSKVTCPDCVRAVSDRVPDAQQAEQMRDAGWLRQQGEDFKSLRALVEAVNESEKRHVGDDEPFKPGGKNTRAHYVKTISTDLENVHHHYGQKDRVSAYPKSLTAPAGGLCHDDAKTLIGVLRTSVDALRAGRAWPDDARLVAGQMEKVVDGVLGKVDETPVKYVSACASGCGAALPTGASPGGLCARCMKGANRGR